MNGIGGYKHNFTGSSQSSKSPLGLTNSVEEIEVTCFAELLLNSAEGKNSSLESVETIYNHNQQFNVEMDEAQPV